MNPRLTGIADVGRDIVGVHARKQRAIKAGVFHPPLCGGLLSSSACEPAEIV
jgi:hypothetical protein